jgi:hypothetical protein
VAQPYYGRLAMGKRQPYSYNSIGAPILRPLATTVAQPYYTRLKVGERQLYSYYSIEEPIFRLLTTTVTQPYYGQSEGGALRLRSFHCSAVRTSRYRTSRVGRRYPMQLSRGTQLFSSYCLHTTPLFLKTVSYNECFFPEQQNKKRLMIAAEHSFSATL